MTTTRPFRLLPPAVACGLPAALALLGTSAPLRAQTPYQQAVLEAGPVLYWTFDEAGDLDNAHSLVDDQPDNELVPEGAATRAPSTTTAGGLSLGRAAAFEFEADPQSRFRAFNLAPIDPLESFAVEFWFRTDNSPSRYFSEMFSDDESTPNLPGVIWNFNAGEFELFAGGRTGTVVSPDEWHHVVAASYRFGEGVEIYIDGVAAEVVDRNGGFAQVHEFGPFALGNTLNNPQCINGMMDEYAIYDLGALDDLAARQAHVALIASHYSVGPDPLDPSIAGPTSVVLDAIVADAATGTGTIPVSNTGATQTLTISAVAFGDPDGNRFAVAEGTAFPIAVEPGASGVIPVVFTSGAGPGTFSTVATIASNDSRTPEKTVSLTISVRGPNLAPTTPYQEAVLAHNPVLYWTFDESGDFDNAVSMVDNQPANELEAMGAATRAPSTSTAGGVSLGRAAAFEFEADPQSRFTAPDLARTGVLNSFAIEFWFLADESDPRYFSEVFSEENIPNQPGVIHNYNFGELELFAGGRTGIVVEPGQWHHVVAAWYGAGNGTGFFLDGQEAELFERDGGFDRPHAFGGIAIGNTLNNPQCINGMMDEYAIYDLGGLDDVPARQAHAAAIAGHYLIGDGTPAEPFDFRITDIARTVAGDTATASLTFRSRAGRTYTVLSSTDLAAWTELAPVVTATGESTTFQDTRNLAGQPRVFYKVRENPQ